jgi:glycosyltransferase involved in cell wall biosynthesis
VQQSRRRAEPLAWSAVGLARACRSALGGRRGAPTNGAAQPPETVPVTVVIPAYNRERMLSRALESVLAQRPTPAEIVVVDDASTDRTAAVAEEMGARVVRHERNAGEGAARNSGIAAATQPWIALLDSDDEWLPSHLATLWRARSDHVVVATTAIRRGADPANDRLHGTANSRPLVLRTPAGIVFPENPVPVSAVMIRRDVAVSAGGYQPLPHCADFDFLLRCLDQGTGVVLPDVGVLYHLHPEQVSHQRELMKEAHARISRSYSDRPWYERRQIRRWSAAVAWDMYRLEGGARRAWALARPWHIDPLMRLWWWRFKLRRRSARIRRDGALS